MKSILPDLKSLEVWFVTGSQHLYGPETLAQVAKDSGAIAAALDPKLPVKCVFKPVVKTPEEIEKICVEANSAPNCVGIVAWMHTFSPAKMWIAGLSKLAKPFLHFHTQFNRDIPWSTIDMDFMNLNQSAHGDREFGFICSRLRLARAVVVGHWQDPAAVSEIGDWCRAAAALADLRSCKVARFGDNMRDVAVTEGDKVEAQIALGMSVYGYGIGDLSACVKAASDAEVEAILADYDASYEVAPELKKGGAKREALKESARIEAGMRAFLTAGGFKAFTDTFEDLHGIAQLPGLATQRLMAEGYGFGAEGDWKTAALVRAMKVMAAGLPGGTSFMEDYTYHLDPADTKVLGAHMLEVCPSIAASKPRLEMMPLGIGGKADPARLIFGVSTGKGLNASMVHMGDRFRLIVNPCQVVSGPDMPKLPVARVLWKPEPDLKRAAAAWIYSGGAHHTGFSMALSERHMSLFADMAGIEYVLIDSALPDMRKFRQELTWNDAAYIMSRMKA
jgi:L-arabinose isomerase